MTRRGLHAVVGLALLGCTPGLGVAEPGRPVAADAAAACIRAPLDPQPVWAFQGRFVDGGRTLVVCDVGAGVLRVYDADGNAERTVAHPGNGPLEFNRPARIAEAPGGSLLQDGSRFLWLDDELRPVRSLDLESVPVAPGGTVHALFQWALAGDRVYAIGAARLPDRTWRTGFLSFPPEDPADPRLLREIVVEDRQEYDHYVMGDRHVAVLGGRGYFLAMEASPRILEATGDGSVRRLEAFPAAFSSRPALPPSPGMAGGEIRPRAYESARVAVGLFASAGKLFVLGREPLAESDGGGTRWTLTRIDPRADRVEGSAVLPTRAVHLSVIPGPERWALLEKGSVERVGVQPIPSLLLVPSEWIEGDASPLASGGAKEDLCEAR